MLLLIEFTVLLCANKEFLCKEKIGNVDFKNSTFPFLLLIQKESKTIFNYKITSWPVLADS